MSSHFLVDKGLSLESVWAGFADARGRPFAEPGVRPHYAPDRGFTLVALELALDIDPDRRVVETRTRLTVAPLPAGGLAVVLDLDGVDVRAVEGEDGRALSWRHDGARLSIDGVRPEGETISVRTEGDPPRGLYFTGPTPAEPERATMAWTQLQDEDAHYLFPCLDHPSVKQPVRLSVTAPAGFTVVANGRLRAREGNTWVWEQAEPIPVYLITVVVARLEVVEDALDGLSVRYLAPAGTPADTLRRVFGRTPAMIAHFAEVFGVPYPWARYDQVVVHDFIFGGMENVAATTLTDLVLTDERAALDYDSDDLISHELAHQWFGDLVTCQDWSQGWLNEGFATYAEFVWKARDRGLDEAQLLLFEMLEAYLKEDAGRYRRAIVDYRFREPIDLFDRHLYEKAALVLHTLRAELGGGEDFAGVAFWAGVRAYLERHGHGTVHSRDLQRALEQASGRNLDGFFQQWIHGAGHPSLLVEISHEGELLQVTARQEQTGEGVAEAFALTLRLAVLTASGERRVQLPVRERVQSWTIPCPPPERVSVDTHFQLLADLRVKASRALLIASLRGDPGVIGRVRAARALAEEGSPAAIAALIRALGEEPCWGVRAQIALALGKKGGERAREALLAALADPEPRARRQVVAALGEIAHPDVEAALARLAREGDPSVQVEGEAVRALGRLRSPLTLEVASTLLGRPSWAETLRCRALEALGAARDAAALPVLLDWTRAERPSRARCAAATALGRLADELPSTRVAAVTRLCELAKEPSFRLAFCAIGALGVARDPAAGGLLRALHDGETDGRLKRAAYEALQAIGEGRESGDALAGLRRDLESLREENRALRDRVSKLEPPPAAAR